MAVLVEVPVVEVADVPEVLPARPAAPGSRLDPLIAMLSLPLWLGVLGAVALGSFLLVNVLLWTRVRHPQTAPEVAAQNHPNQTQVQRNEQKSDPCQPEVDKAQARAEDKAQARAEDTSREKAAAEAERERKNAPNPAYLKAQWNVKAAKMAYDAAVAKAPKSAPERPAFPDVEELKGLLIDVMTTNEVVPVYPNARIPQSYFTLREDTTANILHLGRGSARSEVLIISGPHKGDRGWIRRSDLPEKAEKALTAYEDAAKKAKAAQLDYDNLQLDLKVASRRLEEAKTALRNIPATVGEVEAAAVALAEQRAKEEREAEARRKAEEEYDADGLVLLRKTVRGTRGQFGGEITGTVVNRRGRELRYAQITFKLYDESGAQVGTALANITGLEPGGKWNFKATTFGQDFSKYKFSELSGF